MATLMMEHQVVLSPFFIDKYEVSNKRYKTFMDATGHPAPAYWDDRRFNKPNHPVVGANWYDAKSFCEFEGKRLHTEAEWEKAARGPDGRQFPWGNSKPTPEHANFAIDWKGIKSLRPAGSTPKGKSYYGIEDMAGNAREWVQDWYHPQSYLRGPLRNPKGPENGILKVVRGGSWHNGVNDIRVPSRGKGGFALKTDGIGFRCAKDME